MNKQLLAVTITTLLAMGQSASAFEQTNSENAYEPALKNGWVNHNTQAFQAIKVSNTQGSGYIMKLSGSSENDTGNITFTFAATEEVAGNSNPLSINYDSSH